MKLEGDLAGQAGPKSSVSAVNDKISKEAQIKENESNAEMETMTQISGNCPVAAFSNVITDQTEFASCDTRTI